jgi:predicted dehydrogenase
MIHDLDIVRALDGTEVVSVDAVGVPVFSEFEDIANARIRFASGCVANVTCSRVSVDRMRKIRIFAQNAYVSTDYAAQEVLVYSKKPGSLGEGVSPMDLIAIDPLPVKRDEPLKLELASFLECVRERKQPVVSGEDGLAALELAHAIMTFIKEHA